MADEVKDSAAPAPVDTKQQAAADAKTDAPLQSAQEPEKASQSVEDEGSLASQAAATEEGKKPEEAAKPAEGKEKPESAAAPEEYEFKLPEGFTLDAPALEKATGVFKELKLSNENAQKLIDLYVSRAAEASAAQQQAFIQQRREWRAEFNASPSAKEDLARVVKTVNRFASPEAKELILGKDSWLGDNPHLLKFIATVGKELGEAKIRDGGKDGGAALPPEQVMYPSMRGAN